MNRFAKLLTALFAGVLVTIVAFWLWKPATTKRLETTLYLGWIYSGSYAGDVVGATKFAPESQLTINVQQGGQGLDPLKLVGDNSFGVASSDEIIRAISKGARFKIIGVITDESPAAFAALSAANIKTPKDFEGKRVGVLPFGSTGLVYQSLLKRNSVDRSKIEEVVVSPDLRAFISGATHDVQPVFAYDEPVSLDKQKIAYNLILPSDWGVSFKGPAYFTTQQTIDQNPALVYAFLRAMARGWYAVAANQKLGIDELKRLSPTLDEERESEVLRRGLPSFVSPTRKFLLSDSASWDAMVSDMVEFGALDRKMEPSEFIDLSIAQKVYADGID